MRIDVLDRERMKFAKCATDDAVRIKLRRTGKEDEIESCVGHELGLLLLLELCVTESQSSNSKKRDLGSLGDTFDDQSKLT